MARALHVIALSMPGDAAAARAAAASLRERAPRFTTAVWRGFPHSPDRPDVPDFADRLLAAGLRP